MLGSGRATCRFYASTGGESLQAKMCQDKRVATRGSGWRSAGNLHTETTHTDPFIIPGYPRTTTTQQLPPKRRVTKSRTRGRHSWDPRAKKKKQEAEGIPSIQPHPLPPKHALLPSDKTPTRFLGQSLIPFSNNPHSFPQTASPSSNNAHPLPPTTPIPFLQ